MITFNKHSKLWDVSCDSCSHETLEIESDEVGGDGFRDVVRQIKKEGWNVFQENGEWMHTCLECGLPK